MLVCIALFALLFLFLVFLEERGDRLMRYAPLSGISSDQPLIHLIRSLQLSAAMRAVLRFSTFDLDGDGYINMDELRLLLSGEVKTSTKQDETRNHHHHIF